jgi:hypothetical protein
VIIISFERESAVGQAVSTTSIQAVCNEGNVFAIQAVSNTVIKAVSIISFERESGAKQSSK